MRNRHPVLCLSIDVDLDAAQPFSNFSPATIEAGRSLLSGMLRTVPPNLPLHGLRDYARPEHLHEMDLAARILGVELDAVVAANVSYDLAMSVFACSTVALATPDGPVLARNLDWWPEELLARATHRIVYRRDGETRFVMAGFPGGVAAVSGLSARGFALAVNAVGCPPEDRAPGASATLLFLRHVLEHADSYEQALLWLAQQPLMAPCLITLVGRENWQRVVVERTPNRAWLRRPEGDDPLLATNDYRHPDAPNVAPVGLQGLLASACYRYNALSAQIVDDAGSPRADDPTLLSWLRHPGVEQRITAQHVIARPREGKLLVWRPARF